MDTNMLLLPSRRKIDIFQEIPRIVPEKHEIATLSTVVEELSNLEGRGRDSMAAKTGLQLLKEKKVRIIKSTGDVDEKLVEMAAPGETIIATNDRELKKKVKAKGAGLIYMRGKNRLERI